MIKLDEALLRIFEQQLFSADEIEAVMAQLRDPSFVNPTLRNSGSLTKSQHQHVKCLDSAIRKSPRFTGTLYRAIPQDILIDGAESGQASDGLNPGSTFTCQDY